MIIDKIENISNYAEIPNCLADTVKSLSKDAVCGRIIINESDYINIETYQTKNIEDAKFEAHRDYIDIQILLSGREKIYYTSISGLTENEPYNESKDIVFYTDEVKAQDYLTLDGTNFAMIFPHEAHAPQVSVNENSEIVKKVVVKLKK